MVEAGGKGCEGGTREGSAAGAQSCSDTLGVIICRPLLDRATSIASYFTGGLLDTVGVNSFDLQCTCIAMTTPPHEPYVVTVLKRNQQRPHQISLHEAGFAMVFIDGLGCCHMNMNSLAYLLVSRQTHLPPDTL